jgi:hypothetical protein
MQAHKESRHRRQRSVLPHRSVVDIDPEDPAQQLDEAGDFHIEPLDVEAQPAAEGDEVFDQAQAESRAGEPEDIEKPSETESEAIEAGEPDTGELYGVHVAPAGDRELAASEDRDAFADSDLGENWLESLETHAAEGGPAPERDVVIIDDSDPHSGPPSTDFRDRPKADRGAGGRGGL